MENYTKEILQSKTVPQLIRITKDLKIPTGQRKKDLLIDKILNVEEEREKLKQKKRTLVDEIIEKHHLEEEEQRQSSSDEEEEDPTISLDDPQNETFVLNFPLHIDLSQFLDNGNLNMEFVWDEEKEFLKINDHVFQKNSEEQILVMATQNFRKQKSFTESTVILKANESSFTELIKKRKIEK